MGRAIPDDKERQKHSFSTAFIPGRALVFGHTPQSFFRAQLSRQKNPPLTFLLHPLSPCKRRVATQNNMKPTFAFLFPALAIQALATTYSISDTVIGSSFLNFFDFEVISDPAHGRV